MGFFDDADISYLNIEIIVNVSKNTTVKNLNFTLMMKKNHWQRAWFFLNIWEMAVNIAKEEGP